MASQERDIPWTEKEAIVRPDIVIYSMF
jgi:hypothetical protein